MNWFQIKAYLKYIIQVKYRFGDSVFISDLFDCVFYETYRYYQFDNVDNLRKRLLQSSQKIEVTDFGAGSKKFKNNHRSLRQLVKYNASSKAQGELIFRLVNFFKPKNIIELGSSLGLGTLYLALPNSKTKVFTIEGCPELAKCAKNNYLAAGANNITLQTGNFKEVLPGVLALLDKVDMVYFDGHHNYQATLEYFNCCVPKASESAVFIFDDIHWSEGMNRAWSEIIAHPAVSVSYDLFRFGIAILNVDIDKQHGVIKRF